MANTAGYKLRTAAHKHLSETECTTLKICIRRFRETRSVLGLCTALQRFLDTPEKVHMMALIFPMIPEDLQMDFDNLSRLQFEHYATLIRPKLIDKYKLGSVKKPSPTKGRDRKSSSRVLLPVEHIHNIAEAREHTMQTFKGRGYEVHDGGRREKSTEVRPAGKNLKRSKTYHAPEQSLVGLNSSNSERLPSSSEFKEPQQPPAALNTSHTSSDSTPRVRLGELRQNATPKTLKLRRVTLERREGQSFGFCIRGGVDHNTGIFVSEVDPGGQAERKGMRVGERILKVNNYVFKNISHSQAVVAIKSSPRINVYLAPLGQMPGSSSTTPRMSDGVGSTLGSQLRLPSCDTLNTEVTQSCGRKVTILAEEDGWLGFSIRGGKDQNLDITVASVDPSSPADRSGLKKGERIVKVNGADIGDMEHMQIVNLVLSSSIVVLHVLEVPRRPSQGSAVTSKLRGRHVSSSSSTGSRGGKKEGTTASGSRTNLDVGSAHPNRRRAPTSPIPETDREIAQFVAELQSTPPVSTSTPLPPDDDPRLIKNRNQYMREMYNASATDEATILRMMREGHEVQPQGVTLNLSKLSERTEEAQSTPGGRSIVGNEDRRDSSRRRSKFDQGTIRLNLANTGDKEVLKEAKVINIDIEDDLPVERKQRRHVKDLFDQKQELNRRHSPSSQVQPDGQHQDIPDGYTPRMNILSSPYASYDRERHIKSSALSPSSKDLKSAVGAATSQISKELTGKTKTMTTCNVPPSPHTSSSPVSKFIHKVLKRNSGGKELVKGSQLSPSGNRGSTDSLNSGHGSLRFGKSRTESTIAGSAYDLMKMGAADLSSTDGD